MENNPWVTRNTFIICDLPGYSVLAGGSEENVGIRIGGVGIRNSLAIHLLGHMSYDRSGIQTNVNWCSHHALERVSPHNECSFSISPHTGMSLR